MATKKEENKRKIELNQDLMLIDKKKGRNRGLMETLCQDKATYKTWVKLKLLYQEIFIKPVLGYEDFLRKEN